MRWALLQQAGMAGAKAALCALAACASVPRAATTRRIEARGYGPAYPVASNDTPVGRQLNRRVQVVIATNSQ